MAALGNPDASSLILSTPVLKSAPFLHELTYSIGVYCVPDNGPLEWLPLKGRPYHHDEELQLTRVSGNVREFQNHAHSPYTDALSRKTERSTVHPANESQNAKSHAGVDKNLL